MLYISKIKIRAIQNTSVLFDTINANEHLPINYWCINYNQSNIQNKIKNKFCMKVIYYACFKLEEITTRNVKKNKNNFINVIGDKFVMNIRRGKLTISFCTKLYSWINYLQLLK